MISWHIKYSLCVGHFPEHTILHCTWLIHLIIPQPYEMTPDMISILQIRKTSQREEFVQGHTFKLNVRVWFQGPTEMTLKQQRKIEPQRREMLGTGIWVSSTDPQGLSGYYQRGVTKTQTLEHCFSLNKLTQYLQKLFIEKNIRGGISYQRGFLYLIITR